MADMIEIRNLNKYFGDLHVLKDVNLSVKEGEKLVLIGPSGSGKSTLIRSINWLEEPTSGEVYIDGQLMTRKNHNDLTRKYTSMVFQQFNLYPNMTVMGNLTLAPMKLQKKSREQAEAEAMKNLERVGLVHKANEFPQNLSGGQQQRVAIARAVVSNPKLILADEPTGNLDSKNGKEVMDLLTELNKEGTTIVMVTHSQKDAACAQRIVNLFDGEIVSDVKNEL